jgi:hypothetical protein
MRGDSDARVISRSLNDPECFEVAFDRHFVSIHRYLRRRRPNPAAFRDSVAG